MRNYYARVPASLYSEANRFRIAGEARRELGAGYEKISSKLNERGRVLVPSFGSADRSEISKKISRFYRRNSRFSSYADSTYD